ncbi:MAG: FAD-dependent oxidoreductase [Burkholderiales bacterium]
MSAGLHRRQWLQAAAALSLPVAAQEGAPAPPARWLGGPSERGHRLRETKSGRWPGVAQNHRAQVLVIGAGVAGLAAARALVRLGVDDVQVLELDDEAGGNSRGHRLRGLDCPLGAHYLPVPGDAAREVRGLLEDYGLVRHSLGRWVYDERHLCHSPQERLFFDGAWHDGLLPPAAPGSTTLAQYRRFAAAVERLRRTPGFAIPTAAVSWTVAHAALDGLSFAAWLDREQLDDPHLRWYLDYCCRDDYGADAATVSAWAGLHYFASRHGFQAPGDEADERAPVLTWPEGNAWLTRRLRADLGERLHTACMALRIRPQRHGVEVLAWDAQRHALQRWQAARVVLAVPLMVAVRLLDAPPVALVQAARQTQYAPWMVANVHVERPLLERVGVPRAWDNVVYGSASLGYVDAGHQHLDPTPGSTVLSVYWALPVAERAALLAAPASAWAGRVLTELAPMHPDLPRKASEVVLTRYGHAMAVPTPGTRGQPARAALRTGQGRLHFAHADLSGYSVFEEAYTLGLAAARQCWQAGRRR